MHAWSYLPSKRQVQYYIQPRAVALAAAVMCIVVRRTEYSMAVLIGRMIGRSVLYVKESSSCKRSTSGIPSQFDGSPTTMGSP
jgi:hypothetical protein